MQAEPDQLDMTGMMWGLLGLFFGFVILMAVLLVLRRRVGGGWGPQEMADGSLTSTPTGYPEEMHGHGKKIKPIDAA